MKHELNRRYLEFREREYEIDKLLEENMNEYLSKPKNEDFVYLDREYWEMLGYEPNEFQEMYPDHELPDFDELELEYDDYLNHLEKSLLNRIELYDKRMKNIREFERWMDRNNFIYWDVDEECASKAKRYNDKWYGWTSNDLVNTAMYVTIDYTSEEEVNKVVENAKKVIEYFIKDMTYSEEYVHDLDYVNRILRNGKAEGTEPFFVLDCLENDCVWNIYKEPFSRFVEHVERMIDREYLNYLKEMKRVDNE